MTQRGFFAIGIFHPKTELNVGTLWRSAHCFGASYVFTVGRRYRSQASDTMNVPGHLPLFHYADIDDLAEHLPHGCPLVGIELDARARPLTQFNHPERAAYLLGAEDHGLPPAVVERCHLLVEIPFAKRCLNVATAGSIVAYDRARTRERRRVVEDTAAPERESSAGGSKAGDQSP